MVYVYTLLLEQNKYYVGKTDNPQFRIDSHFHASGSAWTKKYPPLKLLDLIPDCDHFDEDKYTKVYMNKYGINNVRGGSFCQIELDKITYEMLEKMIFSATDKCYLCGEEGHFINNCPYENDPYENDEFHINNCSYENCDSLPDSYDTILDWTSSVKSKNPLFITKTFLIKVIKVNWFLINYKDRYSTTDPVRLERWNLSVIQIRKDILNDKIVNNNILKQLTIVCETLGRQLGLLRDQDLVYGRELASRRYRYVGKKKVECLESDRDRKERDLYTRKYKVSTRILSHKTEILRILQRELNKIKTFSHLSFCDYFTDLLLINID